MPAGPALRPAILKIPTEEYKKNNNRKYHPQTVHHCTMYFNPNDYKVSDQYDNISSTTNINNNQQFITQTIQDMENFKPKLQQNLLRL